MATRSSIENKIPQYLKEENGFIFLRKEYVSTVQDLIISHYKNVYTSVEDSEHGRKKLVVGKIGKKVASLSLKYTLIKELKII